MKYFLCLDLVLQWDSRGNTICQFLHYSDVMTPYSGRMQWRDERRRDARKLLLMYEFPNGSILSVCVASLRRPYYIFRRVTCTCEDFLAVSANAVTVAKYTEEKKKIAIDTLRRRSGIIQANSYLVAQCLIVASTVRWVSCICVGCFVTTWLHKW